MRAVQAVHERFQVDKGKGDLAKGKSKKPEKGKARRRDDAKRRAAQARSLSPRPRLDGFQWNVRYTFLPFLFSSSNQAVQSMRQRKVKHGEAEGRTGIGPRGIKLKSAQSGREARDDQNDDSRIPAAEGGESFDWLGNLHLGGVGKPKGSGTNLEQKPFQPQCREPAPAGECTTPPEQIVKAAPGKMETRTLGSFPDGNKARAAFEDKPRNLETAHQYAHQLRDVIVNAALGRTGANIAPADLCRQLCESISAYCENNTNTNTNTNDGNQLGVRREEHAEQERETATELRHQSSGARSNKRVKSDQLSAESMVEFDEGSWLEASACDKRHSFDGVEDALARDLGFADTGWEGLMEGWSSSSADISDCDPFGDSQPF